MNKDGGFELLDDIILQVRRNFINAMVQQSKKERAERTRAEQETVQLETALKAVIDGDAGRAGYVLHKLTGCSNNMRVQVLLSVCDFLNQQYLLSMHTLHYAAGLHHSGTRASSRVLSLSRSGLVCSSRRILPSSGAGGSLLAC